MRKRDLSLAYSTLLGACGIDPDGPEDLRGNHSKAVIEWREDVIKALQDDYEVMGFFLSESFGQRAQGTYQRLAAEDPAMAYLISRGYESVAKRAFEDPRCAATLKYLMFQLDEQAATVLGEQVLLEPHVLLSTGNLATTDGVLAQKNLPVRIADQLLLTCPGKIEVPLSPSKFSQEALKKVAEWDGFSLLDPIVAISNPFLDEATFLEIATRNLSATLTASANVLSTMVLTPERWNMLVSHVVPTWYAAQKYVEDIALNPSLPREAALHIHKKLQGKVIFGSENADIHLDDPSSLIERKINPIAFGKTLTTPEQLDRFYDIAGARSYRSILHNANSSAALIDKVITGPQGLILTYGSYIADDYVEPNLWALEAEVYDYLQYGPKYKAEFEEKMTQVLTREGYVEFLEGPRSWQAQMLTLLLEDKKRKLNVEA